MSSKKKIYLLIGTRPNFIKVTQFKRISETQFPHMEVKFIHTGQHFDANMADVFFKQLGLQPNYFLEVGGMSPNSQVASIILKLEELFQKEGKPDFLIVPGDVNSTLAGAIAANKLGVKLIHLESGLRSFDRKMPEEHNRIVADNLSDICFVTEPSGLENLSKEHIGADVHWVGNTMIDTLVYFEESIDDCNVLRDLELEPRSYVLGTFHRPSNVDSKEDLTKLVELLIEVSKSQKVVVPFHPRTKKKLESFDLWESIDATENIISTEPQGYFEFQKLIKESTLVLTDSGGIQEETTYRQIPCLTLRENTERPVTITQGTNELIEFDVQKIMSAISKISNGNWKKGEIPKYWDGNATSRILKVIDRY